MVKTYCSMLNLIFCQWAVVARGYSLFQCELSVLFTVWIHKRAYRTLKIYGPSDKRAQLEPKLIWATPGQRGFGPKAGGASVKASSVAPATQRSMGMPSLPSHPGSAKSYAYTFSNTSSSGPSSTQSAAPKLTAAQLAAQQEAARKRQEAEAKAQELRQILNSLEKVDDEGRRTSLLDTLCSTEDVLALPMHPNPPGIQTGDLKVNLLKHQVSFRRSTHDPLTNSLGFRVRLYNGV